MGLFVVMCEFLFSPGAPSVVVFGKSGRPNCYFAVCGALASSIVTRKGFSVANSHAPVSTSSSSLRCSIQCFGSTYPCPARIVRLCFVPHPHIGDFFLRSFVYVCFAPFPRQASNCGSFGVPAALVSATWKLAQVPAPVIFFIQATWSGPLCKELTGAAY